MEGLPSLSPPESLPPGTDRTKTDLGVGGPRVASVVEPNLPNVVVLHTVGYSN